LVNPSGCLKIFPFPWCNASRGFVSDIWATGTCCWSKDKMSWL